MTTTNDSPINEAQPLVVHFSRGTFNNRFGTTTEFNRPGCMRPFKAAFCQDSGWTFFGDAVDEDWRKELTFNADPAHQHVVAVRGEHLTSFAPRDLVAAIDRLAQSLCTDDGYRFTQKTPEGMWTDTDLALGPDVAEYEHVAGVLTIEPRPFAPTDAFDISGVFEEATMNALGWVTADALTKSQIDGARYYRKLGGPGTPFATYDLTIACTERGWIPVHGIVRMGPVESAYAAAVALEQHWLQLPLAERVHYQYLRERMTSKFQESKPDMGVPK